MDSTTKLTLKQQDNAVVAKFWAGWLRNPPQRYLELKYARLLIREHGFEKTMELIDAVYAAAGKTYSPGINSVKDLYYKQRKLADFYLRNQAERPNVYQA